MNLQNGNRQSNLFLTQATFIEYVSVYVPVPTYSDFYHLMITFENSLDPDQAAQNVGPDLDPNYLTC